LKDIKTSENYYVNGILVYNEFVYFLCAYLHKNIFNQIYSYEMGGIYFLILVLFMNAITILEYLELVDKLQLIPPIASYGIVLFVLFVINAVRYKKYILYADLSKKWDSKNKNTKFVKIFIVICYFLISIIALVSI